MCRNEVELCILQLILLKKEMTLDGLDKMMASVKDLDIGQSFLALFKKYLICFQIADSTKQS